MPSPSPASSSPLVAAEVAELVERGDTLFAAGDVASARLFYERAADAGEAQAALRLGESFDPAFLEQAHARNGRGDLGTAKIWYRRARELGSAGAEILLKSLEGN
jgi:TPR repeat protein